MKQVLTIAGSDSGAGAGIQADLKTFHAHGVYGTTVLTSVTAQNTRALTHAYDLPLEIIEAQLDAVLEDFEIAAVKTGMLASAAIVAAVARKLAQWSPPNLVVDPVMLSKSGYPLLRDDAVDVLKERLFRLATLVTPNVPEAERLTGMAIDSLEAMQKAARRIGTWGSRAVLIKGGHLGGPEAVDVLWDGEQFHYFRAERLPAHPHGTGCTYASAVAARLALGDPLPQAVAGAKRYVTEAIRRSLSLGHGWHPLDHFYSFRESQHKNGE